MSVPCANVMLDTRQISHYKWSCSKDYPDERWIVKFAKSHENEEMDEAILKEAVGEAAPHLAKSCAKGKGGFVPIPVGDATSQRGFAIILTSKFIFNNKNAQHTSFPLLPLHYGSSDYLIYHWLLHPKQTKVKEIHLHRNVWLLSFMRTEPGCNPKNKSSYKV